MKKLFYLGILFFTSVIYAQPGFTVIDSSINCHQGYVDVTISIDGTTDGYFFSEYYNDTTWGSTGGSEWISVGDTDTLQFLVTGIGQIMHDYDSIRVCYFHTPTQDTILVLMVSPNCGSSMSIETDNQSWAIKERKYYTMSGQPIKDIEISGIYIEITTYDNNRQSIKKIGKCIQ